MYCIGQLHLLGLGTPKDAKKAFPWYEKAAAKGISEAMFNLAVAFDQGLGTDPDAQAASEWYLKAANSGQVDAMVNIAQLYLTNRLGKPDPKEAR